MVQRRKEEGKPIGRPKKLDTEELERVYEWREKGLSYGEIVTLAGEIFDTTSPDRRSTVLQGRP